MWWKARELKTTLDATSATARNAPDLAHIVPHVRLRRHVCVLQDLVVRPALLAPVRAPRRSCRMGQEIFRYTRRQHNALHRIAQRVSLHCPRAPIVFLEASFLFSGVIVAE